MTSQDKPARSRRAKRIADQAPEQPQSEPTKVPEAMPLIVGIGASAGGLEAYKHFFDNMPVEGNIAFVLVQHLSPDHVSMMADLLARHTSMPVSEATDGTPVEARHVYIIPPDATLTIADGVLQLSKPAPPRQYAGRSTPFSNRWRKTRATTPWASSSQAVAVTVPGGCVR